MKRPTIKLSIRKKSTPPARITNETVAEHREHILTGGRRFKYPVQYARHRLVINAIVLIVITVVLAVAVGWWQLYLVQNNTTFFYRVTRILPLPVATVDGQTVRYSDYMMYLNSSIHYLEQSEQVNINSADGKRQVDRIKRKSVDNAIADAYSYKLALGLNISVSESDIDKVVDTDRDTSNGRISQETYDASALNILGWTVGEYRQDIKSKLIKQAVSYAIDDGAQATELKVPTTLATNGGDFDATAKVLNAQGGSGVTVGVSGLVPLTNHDGGLTEVASHLAKNQVSGVIKSSSSAGYYFVKLLDKTDTQLSYAYILVPLTEFDSRLARLKTDGKIHEYISIPIISDQLTK